MIDPTTDQPDALQQRVADLEAAMARVVAELHLLRQQIEAPVVLRARMLEVVDAAGRPRCRIAAAADGAAFLALLDHQGRDAVSLTADDELSAVVAWHAGHRVGVLAATAGGGRLMMAAPGGFKRVLEPLPADDDDED